MNTRLVMKLALILAVMLFMVIMGMSNHDAITFKFNLFGYTSPKVTAALMYFIFFSVGVLTGGLLATGGGASKPKGGKG
jgi:uncharacterized membrane protein YciS (DUF1049 family)